MVVSIVIFVISFFISFKAWPICPDALNFSLPIKINQFSLLNRETTWEALNFEIHPTCQNFKSSEEYSQYFDDYSKIPPHTDLKGSLIYVTNQALNCLRSPPLNTNPANLKVAEQMENALIKGSPGVPQYKNKKIVLTCLNSPDQKQKTSTLIRGENVFSKYGYASATLPEVDNAPYITLNEDLFKNVSIQSAQDALFHELFHIGGFYHGQGFEYAHVATECCMKKDAKACDILQTEGDPESESYLTKIIDFTTHFEDNIRMINSMMFSKKLSPKSWKKVFYQWHVKSLKYNISQSLKNFAFLQCRIQSEMFAGNDVQKELEECNSANADIVNRPIEMRFYSHLTQLYKYQYTIGQGKKLSVEQKMDMAKRLEDVKNIDVGKIRDAKDTVAYIMANLRPTPEMDSSSWKTYHKIAKALNR